MDPTMDPRLAAYLEGAMAVAATQDLTQDQRSSIRVLSIVFSILAVVFVGLRFLARHRQRAKYGIDDWMMVVSLAFLGGNLACTLVRMYTLSKLFWILTSESGPQRSWTSFGCINPRSGSKFGQSMFSSY